MAKNKQGPSTKANNWHHRKAQLQTLLDCRGDDEEEGDMDTDSFIEYSDEEEGMANDETRDERRREKKQDAERRKRARRVRPELAGIDAKYAPISYSGRNILSFG